VDAEITGLAEQYRQGGIRRLVFVVDARSRRPGSSLYLVTTRAGEGLAGNVGSLATGILETPGWTETAYRRLDDPDGAEHEALIRVFQLPSGFRLLVGRDLEERERISQTENGADEARWSAEDAPNGEHKPRSCCYQSSHRLDGSGDGSCGRGYSSRR